MEFKSNKERINETNLSDSLYDIKKYFPQQIMKAIKMPYDINEILRDASEKFFLKKIVPINQGKVHYVYKCLSENNNYVLKIRNNHFHKNSKILIDPSLIEDEYMSYKTIQKKWSNLVPRVINYDYDHKYILVSYLQDQSIEENIQSLKETILITIAKDLGIFHKLFSNSHIREINKENITYKNLLYYRYGFLKDNRIFELIKEMYGQRDSLIHGDLTPENILFDKKSNHIKLIDLETVHFGNSEFDIGFFLAHILIRNLNNENLNNMLKIFLETYLYYNNSNINLISKNIGATILYRIHSEFKYCQERDIQYLQKIANILLDNPCSSLSFFDILLNNKGN